MRKKFLKEQLAALETKRQLTREKYLAESNKLIALSTAGEPVTNEQTLALSAIQTEIEQLSTEHAALKTELDAIENLEDTARRNAAELERQPNNKGGNPHDLAGDKPFRSLGEQLMAVREVETSRRANVDARLHKYDLSNPEVRLAAGMSEGVGSDGGFLLTTELGEALQKAAFESGDVAGRCTKIPISNNSNSITLPAVKEISRADGSRWGGIRGYWLAEAGVIAPSKPTFDVITLKLKKFGVLAYMTDELTMDATAAESYLNMAASDEVSYGIDNAIFRGTGAGMPLGFLNAASTVSVAKETSQAALTILYANVSKMKARMLPRSFQRAVWYVNVDCTTQLESMFVPYKNVAGTENVGGSAVYIPPGGASGQPYGTLFGRPVIPVEQCATVGTVGDIVLMDPAMYLLATKGGVQAASSIHVNFTTDEMAFRFIIRTDGQPALKSAVTPANGSNTLGGIITLATRA